MMTHNTGRQIKVIRTLRGLSLDDLSERTGINASWISRIENGIVNPQEKQIDAIKAALSWPSDEAVEAAFRALAGESTECAK